ncbi:Alpha/beta hydrolase fold-3, partial [Cunninghamella echinulata]
IAVKSKVNVVFIDYHLSPGSKFPVPVEECYSSVLWIYQHGKELNVNIEKIFIGGDSAGGNLTAATVSKFI